MKVSRWIGVAALGVWCLGGGAALSAEDKSPKMGQPRAESKPESKASDGAGAKVNINAASRAELMTLEGVGAGAAKRIIAYREANGPFKRPQDLAKVQGLAKAVLDKNAGRITVK